MDDALEAFKNALEAQAIAYNTIRANFAAGTSLSSTFQEALAAAYATYTGGSTGGGSTGGGSTGGGSTGGGSTGGGSTGGGSTGGNYTLLLEVTTFGFTTPITITNLPKPSTQDEFCNAVVEGTGEASIRSALASAGGTLTVNSCSFSGSVGNISLTLSLTSPIAMTVPYTAKYTYQ
jgi:hypothetical protein